MSDSDSLTVKIRNLKYELSHDFQTQIAELAGSKDQAKHLLKPSASLIYVAAQVLLDATGHCVSISAEDAEILSLSVFRAECLTPRLAPTIDLDLASRNLLRDTKVSTAIADTLGKSKRTVDGYRNYTVKNLPPEIRDALARHLSWEQLLSSTRRGGKRYRGQESTFLRLNRIECPIMRRIVGFCFTSARSLDQYLTLRRRIFALLFPTPFATLKHHERYANNCLGASALGIPAFRIELDARTSWAAWLESSLQEAFAGSFHIHWADYRRWGTDGKHDRDYRGSAIVIPLRCFDPAEAAKQVKRCVHSVSWNDDRGATQTEKVKVERLHEVRDLFPRIDWAKPPEKFIHGPILDFDSIEPLLQAIVDDVHREDVKPSTPGSTIPPVGILNGLSTVPSTTTAST